jgi:Tol biopolymer transport system component
MSSAGSGGDSSDDESGGAGGVAVAEPPPACAENEAFGMATPLGGLPIGSARAHLSRDELLVYYALNLGSDRHWDLVVATRVDLAGTFSTGELLANVNGPSWEFNPSLTSNGLELFFESVSSTGFHLFHASRARLNDEFGAAEMLARFSDTQEGGPFISPDGADLYFHTDQEGVQGVMHAARVGSAFGPPRALELAAPSYVEAFPVVSSDGLTLYFASDQPGGAGGWDIWKASRATAADEFEGAVPLSALNTPEAEIPSSVSADHCRLYFERTGPNWVDSQVYVARR